MSDQLPASVQLAVDVLTWLARDDERLMAFLGLSGASVDDLRIRAQDPEFLGFLIDFLLQDEEALIAFCDDMGHDYETPMRLRAGLPGGPGPEWT